MVQKKQLFSPELEEHTYPQLWLRWKRFYRADGSSQRNLRNAFSSILMLTTILQLPNNVLGDAIEIFTQIYRKRLTKGRGVKPFCALAVYLACKRNSRATSHRTIITEIGTTVHKFWISYYAYKKYI